MVVIYILLFTRGRAYADKRHRSTIGSGYFLNTLELFARSRLVRCVSESEGGGDSVGRTQALCGGVGDAGVGDGDWI
jgi:hypothetical protein